MSLAFTGRFPARRLRRMRRDDFSRRMMRESRLGAEDFIYPVFVQEGADRATPVPSLPGVSRKSIDLLLRDAERCVAARRSGAAELRVSGALQAVLMLSSSL